MFNKIKHNYSIILFILLVVGFILRFYFIQLDPFLHNWDEHFHALVGKNLSTNPLKPMLIVNPVVPYKIAEWNANHIWVHKQPLFLWQIALSIKMLGNTVLAVRFPSLIMTWLSILMVYRITLLFTRNARTAIFAALLICFSNFQLNLISGRYATDHNDVAFGFYVLCSIWSYIEYIEKPKWYWIVLIGVFSGSAILVKWLTGLLVYSAWGIQILIDLRHKKFFQITLPFILSVLIAFIVFVPWQLYIASYFPAETTYENDFNKRHLWEALEGNGGGIFYYVKKFRSYYGVLGTILFSLGLLVSINKVELNKKIGQTLLVLFVIAFVFFSFIVATKMPAFMYCVFPIGIIYAAIGLENISQRINTKWLFGLFLLMVLFETVNPINIWKYNLKPEVAIKSHNTDILKNIDKILPTDIQIVMNLGSNENIDLMYFSNRNITAYQGVVSAKDLQELLKRKATIAVFGSHGKYQIPDYIKEYPYLFIIDEKLKD